MIKQTVLVLAVAVCLAACSKNNATPVTNTPPPVDTTTSDLKYSGNFENGPYGATMGRARLYVSNSQWQLRLENFTVSAGPDLKVYISKEQQPLNFIRLGSLQSTAGDQLYNVPGMPDFGEYRYALIHCEKFNHLFGWALLGKE